ncbi:MAG TPA: peroxiredoxin family protein [Solirubrobacteraceae bacterium]|nr:peroxiredoxin family protein [Solirubrobacteraceae bacterium]
MIIQPGTPAPQFTLRTEEGDTFTRDDLAGQTTVLVFYPTAFSPVCTDQLQVYEEALEELRAQGAVLYGVSTDASDSQRAFRESLNVTIPQLSDFEPKGQTARAFGAYFEPGGMTDRALVIIGPDQVVTWSHLAANPGELPGVNLIFDGLQAA